MNALQTAFRFSEADLAANRTGRATEPQLKRLKTRQRLLTSFFGFFFGFGFLGCFGIGLVGFVFIALVALVGQVAPQLAEGNEEIVLWGLFGLTMIGALIFLVATITIIVRLMRRRFRKVASDIRTYSGNFLLRKSNDIDYSDELEIGGRKFMISRQQLNALEPFRGQPIHLYAFDRVGVILSIEPLGPVVESSLIQEIGIIE